MKTTKLHLLRLGALVFGACVSLCGLASGQTTESNQPLSHTDRSFLEKAAKDSMQEVSISQIAVDKAANPKVKEFAQQMVDDHTAANEKLTQIAQEKGVTLPSPKPAPSKWSKKSGGDFDEDYVDKMVSDHESVVKLFQEEANDGQDAEVVKFARATLPKLQHHLEMANDLEKSLK